MPAFTYATAEDAEVYLPNVTSELWAGDSDALNASLVRASKEVNERLGGLDRFSEADLPIEEGEDGFPEVLIKITVYTALYNQVCGTHSGELFEDHWRWLFTVIRDIWIALEKGVYRFGQNPDASSSGSSAITLGRASP